VLLRRHEPCPTSRRIAWNLYLWRQAAGFSAPKAHEELTKVAKSQPHLLSFTMQFNQELNEEVKELAVYMFFVVYLMFQKIFLKEIKTVSAREIVDCYEYNEGLMERLEGVHEKFFDRIAKVEISRQPCVMKYVIETLVDAPEGEDSVALTDKDMGIVFLMLKTVVDVLDKTT
jgi:hypothetical protein